MNNLINPKKFLDNLNNRSKITPFIILSTPDRNRIQILRNNYQHSSLKEFEKLLSINNFENFFIESTKNNNLDKQKITLLAIVGKNVNYKSRPLKKILAIINTYNEKDIICETITHLLNQGFDVCILDNHSTDDTLEDIKLYFKNNIRVIIRIFNDYGDNYEWYKLLKNTENISYEFNTSYEWFMHNDSNELRYSPFQNITMQEMISFIDSLEYNAIDFTVIDFRFTKDNKNINQNYEANLLDFEFGKKIGHFQQIKCWKYSPHVNLVESLGHNITFINRKVYPLKFLLKHYPLRNINQAKKKIFQDRQHRIVCENNEKGWHSHYDKFINNSPIEFKHENLIKWNQNIFYSKFFIERISGISIIERE